MAQSTRTNQPDQLAQEEAVVGEEERGCGRQQVFDLLAAGQGQQRNPPPSGMDAGPREAVQQTPPPGHVAGLERHARGKVHAACV